MRCYYCGADTRIKKSRPISGGFGISRTRECEGPQKHTFNTRESGPPKQNLSQTAIRQTGSGRLGRSLFDSERLFNDIQVGVLGRISDSQIHEVIDDVIAALERGGEFYREFTPEEREQFPSADGWLWDRQIAAEVERQLLARNRMAVVLYALSTRGRRDRDGRRGWADARAVLPWLSEQYPHLEIPDLPPLHKQQTQVWVHPGTNAPQPSRLVKRSKSEELRSRDQDFDQERFARSIRHALAGRFDKEHEDANVQLISEWVLWGLAGQGVVFSSQLAIGVLDCLRRIDDIAYLRWAAVLKGIESVTEFSREAIGLVAFPSPRLSLEGAVRLGRDAPLPPAPA